jgi:uncharacterized protein RhaS with RHS repeats
MLALESAPANSKNARRGHRAFFRRSRRGDSPFSRSVAKGWDGCSYDVAPDRLLGRWVQRDPIGYHDGMDLYEYVSSLPTISTDPSGLLSPRDEKFDECYRNCMNRNSWKQVFSWATWPLAQAYCTPYAPLSTERTRQILVRHRETEVVAQLRRLRSME